MDLLTFNSFRSWFWF